jgi:4-amino-4-deoxy-L-arabinose transferase-like glycosyltransferase
MFRRTGMATALAALLAVTVAVRIFDVGGKDLWIDEANSVLISRGNLAELIALLKLDSSPPLYYLLLGGWMRLFGDSESAVRSLSIIPAVLAVGTVLVIGWRLFTPETGILAAALMAVAPIHVFYSQQARMYTLLGLLGLLSSYWLWRAIEDGRRRYFVAYTLATLAALYTHNFALHLLPAHAVIVLWSGAWKRAGRRWLLCAAAIAIGYLPWLPVFLTQLGNAGQYAWYVTWVRRWGSSDIPLSALLSFSPGDPQPFFAFARDPRLFWIPFVSFGLTAAIGLVQAWQRGPHGIKPNSRVLWLACAAVLPLAWSALTSVISTPNWVPGRVDQLVYPCFVLLVAKGLAGLRSSAARPALIFVRYLLALVFGVYSCVGLAHLYGNQSANSDRALAQTIASHARPGDAVLCTGLTRAPLQYYLNRLGTPVKLFSYPREMATHMGNQDVARLTSEPALLREEIRLVEQELLTACEPQSRLFVVLTRGAANQPLAEYLTSQDQLRRVMLMGEFLQAGTMKSVSLWLRRPP